MEVDAVGWCVDQPQGREAVGLLIEEEKPLADEREQQLSRGVVSHGVDVLLLEGRDLLECVGGMVEQVESSAFGAHPELVAVG